MDRIETTMERVADALDNLARVEERQEASSKSVSDHEARLRQIEVEFPSLKEVRRWVIMAVLATASTLILGIMQGTITLGRGGVP